eukprot:4527005-Prymnesium_polylepis.1
MEQQKKCSTVSNWHGRDVRASHTRVKMDRKCATSRPLGQRVPHTQKRAAVRIESRSAHQAHGSGGGAGGRRLAIGA